MQRDDLIYGERFLPVWESSLTFTISEGPEGTSGNVKGEMHLGEILEGYRGLFSGHAIK